MLAVANAHKVPLWPVSMGKNFAYGTAAPRVAVAAWAIAAESDEQAERRHADDAADHGAEAEGRALPQTREADVVASELAEVDETNERAARHETWVELGKVVEDYRTTAHDLTERFDDIFGQRTRYKELGQLLARLPNLKLISQTQVSATLGQQALDQGLTAAAAGLAAPTSTWRPPGRRSRRSWRRVWTRAPGCRARARRASRSAPGRLPRTRLPRAF